MGPSGCAGTSVRNYHYLLLVTQNSAGESYFMAVGCNHACLIKIFRNKKFMEKNLYIATAKQAWAVASSSALSAPM
jgi:hypothetical protein